MSFFMTIDGKRVRAEDGEMVLDVTRREGIPIPTLCVHPAVEAFGACRLCVIEVTKASWGGWKGLMTSCLYPAAADLIIETQSDKVQKVRRDVLDLLLARCPDSDLIQKMAAEHGVLQSSFAPREEADKCILCGLCVRVCAEAATAAISTVSRGHDRKVGTPWGGPPPDCIGCLACSNVCPTGHIEVTKTGTGCSIWGRDFTFKRCEECGAPLPVTDEQAAFLVKARGLDGSYLSRCEGCQRKSSAQALGRIAKWSKLGLNQEEVSS